MAAKESAVDVVVAGAGAAGLTAAIYCARSGLKTRVFDSGRAGGLSADAVEIENYPGIERVAGKELMQRFVAQLGALGLEVEEGREVLNARKPAGGKFFIVEVAAKAGRETAETIRAGAVIIATGSKYKTLRVKGEKELKGMGVSYCAVCDGAFFRGQDVVVVGGGNTGVTCAIYLAGMCRSVKLVEFMPALSCDKVYEPKLAEKKVGMLLNHEVLEILGKENVDGVRVRDRARGKETIAGCSGVFVSIGISPNNGLAKKAGLEMDAKGFVRVNRETMETSIPGIFAAGDINGGVEQAVVAAGEGAVAAVSAFRFLSRGK